MIASQFRQLRDFFRSQDFRHSLLITGGAFAALIVLAFAVGLIFPAVPAQVLTLFSQQMADAGVVSESGSISVPALVISLACGIYLCSRINQYVRKNTRGIMAPTLKNIVRVLALTVLPLLAAAAAVEAYVTPAVMQFFL